MVFNNIIKTIKNMAQEILSAPQRLFLKQTLSTQCRDNSVGERREGEESPIGLILCSEWNTEHIEYLMLDDDSSIKVAQYYTQLPDKRVLAEKE